MRQEGLKNKYAHSVSGSRAMYLKLLLVLMALICLIVQPVYAASFDCKKAATEMEKTICSDSKLSALDEDLAKVYGEIRSQLNGDAQALEKFTKSQREWLAELQQKKDGKIACAASKECLTISYQKRIKELQAKKVTKQAGQPKRYYEVMWAADANLCEKVRSYADRKRMNYMPSDVDFGNVKWIELDHPTRNAINVALAGETRSETLFRWYATRPMGLEWDFLLKVFPHEISFAELAKDPVSFARKAEWTFAPDYVELTGLNGLKSPKPSPWCSKLDHSREDLGCKGRYPIWRFSFFDLIDIDGKIYVTAATEKYQAPDDIDLPVVILVARYIAPKEPPVIFGEPGNMKQLEHCCYLIKIH
jgi:uncharacterized protein